MPTNVYLTNETESTVAIAFVDVGPDDSFSGQFVDPASSVPAKASAVKVLEVDRYPGIWDHTTVGELQFSIDGQFVAAIQIMLHASKLVRSAIYWAWRTPTEAIGSFVTDHDPHSTSYQSNGWTITFTIQGVSAGAGFDDIDVTLARSVVVSSWMEAYAPRIGNTPLNQVRLPGTHDSGTESITSSSPWAPDAEWRKWAPATIVAKWARTQSLPVTGQLEAGVRYLDLRLAPAASGQGYALVHALEGDDFGTFISDVRSFLSSHPSEIVILDINHLFEMDGEGDAVVSLLQNTFGDLIIPPSVGVTVTPNELWAGAGRVIVTYDDDTVVAKYPTILWHRQFASTSAISSRWPKTADLSTLQSDLNGYLSSRTLAKFFVLQAIRTPGAAQFKWLTYSLAKWTVDTNAAVASWLPGWASSSLNIIMVDFIETSAIAGLVIALND